MPLWFGLFLATLGAILREKEAVQKGYIEIDGKNYILGEIVRKENLNNEKT